MAVSLFTNPRYRNILLVAVSILVVAGAAGGAILLLRHFAPVKEPAISQPAADDRSALMKAQDLFAKGDYAGAKTQYQSVLETYRAQKNEVAAKDVEMMIKAVDATAKAPAVPQNTNKNRVTVGSAPKQ